MTQLRIKELCSERGITLVELANRVGMVRESINNMVAGRQSPPVKTLDKIADALGVETWMLLKDPSELSEGIKEPEHEVGAFICPKCGTKFKMIE